MYKSDGNTNKHQIRTLFVRAVLPPELGYVKFSSSSSSLSLSSWTPYNVFTAMNTTRCTTLLYRSKYSHTRYLTIKNYNRPVKCTILLESDSSACLIRLQLISFVTKKRVPVLILNFFSPPRIYHSFARWLCSSLRAKHDGRSSGFLRNGIVLLKF